MENENASIRKLSMAHLGIRDGSDEGDSLGWLVTLRVLGSDEGTADGMSEGADDGASVMIAMKFGQV